MSGKRSYGWVPDRPDQRDYLYKTIRPVVRLPKKVDLREFCSIVENQEALGSCTANALAGNLEYLDKKGVLDFAYMKRRNVRSNTINTNAINNLSLRGSDSGRSNLKNGIASPQKQWRARNDINCVCIRRAPIQYSSSDRESLLRKRSREVSDLGYEDVSRLFIYYNERVLEGSVDYDSGASLRDGIKTLRKQGACWEKTWPYLIEHFDRKPPKNCYIEAKKHCIESYHRINSLPEMLTCLAEGYPFVFGFTVYESFQSQRVAKTGVANMPKKKEKAIGGHAVLAVGYNQKQKRFLVRNSWGPKWGQDGYFTMPYEYLETLSADFWTIRK